MILDTNALSAFVDGDSVIGAILARQPRAAIPVIVLGEYRYGILGSRKRATYEAWLDTHLRDFEVLSVTADTAVAYALIRSGLKQIGRPIPANDAWIAALAAEHRLPVLSLDAHFDAITGIQRVAW